MTIIDAHVHLSKIEVFAATARLYSGSDYSVNGFLAECAENGAERAVGMGVTETERYGFPDNSAPTPMPCDMADDIVGGDKTDGPLLYTCAGINPLTLDGHALARLEAELKTPRNAGIKIYAGYYPAHIYDRAYAPVYALAAKYGKAVCVHTGDTFSERGLLEYSHPLNADKLALMYRDVNFVLAHMGDPWIMDACEVAYKNANVYLDTSGLAVGGEEEIARVRDEPLLRDRFRQAILFLNNYDKLLFGTDWPLTKMRPYIEFCETLVDARYHGKFFYDNAVKIYGLL